MFPQGDGTRIAFQQENPKRLGSGAYDLYERYKSSVTVGEARLKGCRQMDFNHDLKKGFLTILAGSGAQATQETPEAARAMPEVPKAVEGAAAEEPRGDAGQVPDTEAVGAAKPRSADGEAKPQAEERAAAPAEAKPPQTAEEALEALKAQPTDSQGLFIRTKGNAASRFVGVSVSKRTGRWEAKFAPAVGSAVILGQFDTEEAAAEAYRDAIFGKPPSAEQAAPGAAMPSAGEGKKEKASGEGGKAGRGADGGKAKEAAQEPRPAATSQRQKQKDKERPPSEGGKASSADEDKRPQPPEAPRAKSAKATPGAKAAKAQGAKAPKAGEAASKAAHMGDAAIAPKAKAGGIRDREGEAAGSKAVAESGPSRAQSITELQKQIDDLTEAQLDVVLEFLEGDVKEGEAFVLNLREMPLQRLHELTKLIAKIHTEAPGAAALAAPKTAPSSALPTAAPSRAVPRPSAAAPRPTPSAAVRPTASGRAPDASPGSAGAAASPAASPPAASPPAASPSPTASAQGRAYGAPGGLYPTAQWYGGAPTPAFGDFRPPLPPPQLQPQLQPPPQPREDVLPWLGDNGGWELGGEPHQLMEMPKIPLGNTDPPGACKEGCRCSQVVSKQSELEKPWLLDMARSRAVQEAMRQLEGCRGVFRRGKCSRQNRLQPAPLGAVDAHFSTGGAAPPG